MANRVLLGNRSAGGYGLYVSKSGNNVIDTANENLLFQSAITDSSTGITTKHGQTFMLIQQEAMAATPGVAERNDYFPAVKDSSGNYSPPFCLAAWEYPSGDQSEPHIGVHYDAGVSNTVLWGGLLSVYGFGYNSSGGGYSSGTMYGRIYTQCDPAAIFYYAVFHMAMER